MSAKHKAGLGRIESMDVDPVAFVSSTIIAIAGTIRPIYPVMCMSTDMTSLCKTPEYPIVTHYQVRGIFRGPHGLVQSLPHLMLLDRNRILDMSRSQEVSTRSMCYWNVILEGVRRFVHGHVLAPDDLLPASLLQRICRKDATVEPLRQRLVHGLYVEGGASEGELRTEIDVQTAAIVTQAAMMKIVCSRGQVLYEELVPFLTMGKGVLTPSVEKGILSFFE
ncbi:hypothetical protein EPO17_02615 [Patescibacteria group bacterium]|nr:MAG: hypothetical protein EPO17_02615 [Patescibacteria group bacterium]